MAENSLRSARRELEQMRHDRDHDKKDVNTLHSDLSLQQTKNQQLSKDVHIAQQEVCSMSILPMFLKLHSPGERIEGSSC